MEQQEHKELKLEELEPGMEVAIIMPAAGNSCGTWLAHRSMVRWVFHTVREVGPSRSWITLDDGWKLKAVDGRLRRMLYAVDEGMQAENRAADAFAEVHRLLDVLADRRYREQTKEMAPDELRALGEVLRRAAGMAGGTSRKE